MAPASRQSIDVAAQDPSLADAKIGVTIASSQPIVVERSTWRGTDGALDEVVSAAGATHGGARWLLAEAEQGGARQAATDVAVFNHGAATDVTVTLLFDGAPEMSATFPVAAGTRFAVPMAEAFPEASGRFSILIEAAESGGRPDRRSLDRLAGTRAGDRRGGGRQAAALTPSCAVGPSGRRARPVTVRGRLTAASGSGRGKAGRRASTEARESRARGIAGGAAGEPSARRQVEHLLQPRDHLGLVVLLVGVLPACPCRGRRPRR